MREELNDDGPAEGNPPSLAHARRWRRLFVPGLVLVAGLVRFVGLDWDQGHAFHPDERAIATAVERISLSPPELNPKFFAYGSLPIYVIRGLSTLVGAAPGQPGGSYHRLLLTGRASSAAAGTLTVLLLYTFGRRLYGHAVGLLSAGLLAACVLHVQHSHFMTTDVTLTLLVVIALFAMVRAADGGPRLTVVIAAIACGMAIATKASALPVGIPLILALWLRRRHIGVSRGGAVGRIGLTLALVGVVSLACEPYALLDFDTFWRQLSEQGRMVRNAGALPFTVQYLGTTPYVYEVGQMIAWGMGPALGLMAVWATGRKLVGLLRQRTAADFVLLAWVVPYFLVTGWFEVRFPRYLLPIYPFLILWAAAWLHAKANEGRFGRILLWAVPTATVLGAAAFLAIYSQPHTAVQASRWTYRQVPDGSRILTPHWDEGFPLSLPLGQPGRYDVEQVPVYEPDGPEKTARLSRQLASADYMVFPTTRIYGSIPRAPQRYPITGKALALLFEGELGYRLAHVEASRPRLLGFEIPDELFDESASVYDHPKVLVFENSARLPAAEVAERIDRLSEPVLLTRRELLLTGYGDHPAAEGPVARAVRSSWPAMLLFASTVELLGLLAFAILRQWGQPPGLYALCKVLGILAFAYPPWLLSHWAPFGFTPSTLIAWLLLLGLVAAGSTARRRWTPPRDWRLVEGLFWGTFFGFLLLRAFNPAIYWGEKPMDFAILNSLFRATQLPPPEPWFAGSSLHYTYFGHYLVAALGKLCHLHPGLAFNLGIALVAALSTTTAFAAGHALSASRRVGLLAVLLAMLLGNLAGPIELLQRRALDFDYFWAISRVVDGTINEFPLWSFLFADLHAHVLAMPLGLAFLTLVFWWCRGGAPAWRAVNLLLLALVLGAVAVTSTWSVPTYALLFPIVLACTLEGPRGAVVRVVAPTGAVLAIAWILYAPFWLHYRSPERRWGWERDAFVQLSDYFLIFGLFFVVAVTALVVGWWREPPPHARSRLPSLLSRSALLVALGSLLLTLPLVRRVFGALLSALFAGSGDGTWLDQLDHYLSSVRYGLVLLAALAVALALRRSTGATERRIAALFAFALLITAGVDTLHVWDRMNTVFKYYLDAWMLFAVASAAALPPFWRGSRRPWKVVVSLLALFGLFTGWSGAWASMRKPRVPSPVPTLDGTAYLAEYRPADHAAIEWLNSHVTGLPVIAEAWGPSYRDYARISVNTGLPTVLGWDYHLLQRSQAQPAIERRKADLETLYTSGDGNQTRTILERYGVALVYVGRLERETYGPRLGEGWSDLLVPVYRTAEVTILANRRHSPAAPATAVEVVDAGEAEPRPALSPPGRLAQPRDVALGPDGRLYVADFDNHRIQVFDSDLQPAVAWGRPGGGEGELRQPCSVDLSEAGEVYVADTWNHRIQVFDRDGTYLRSWHGDLFGPRGIAVSPCGGVYVADTGNHRIRKFLATGALDLQWGGPGDGDGELRDPTGIAIDAACRVYVSDNGNGRLQIFDARGSWLGGFAVAGWRTAPFSEPKIALAPDGLIWVTVPLAGEVRAYDKSGRLQTRIHRPELGRPMGIAFDRTGAELILTDLERGLVRISVGPVSPGEP